MSKYGSSVSHMFEICYLQNVRGYLFIYPKSEVMPIYHLCMYKYWKNSNINKHH